MHFSSSFSLLSFLLPTTRTTLTAKDATEKVSCLVAFSMQYLYTCHLLPLPIMDRERERERESEYFLLQRNLAKSYCWLEDQMLHLFHSVICFQAKCAPLRESNLIQAPFMLLLSLTQCKWWVSVWLSDKIHAEVNKGAKTLEEASFAEKVTNVPEQRE